MNDIASPVTGGPSDHYDTLDTRRLEAAYRAAVNIDVRRYLGDLETLEIRRCRDTGYRFFHPFHVAGPPSFYAELQDQNFYYRLHPEHHRALEFIRTNDAVLEIGCGTGIFVGALRDLGVRAVGLDSNARAVEIGGRSGLDLRCEDLDVHLQQHEGVYDAVCMFQVLEHVDAVRPFLQASLRALRPGGRLIVGVPNNNPYLYQVDKYHALNCPPHHMGLWDEDSLARLPAFFPMTLEHILVEPLEPDEADYYLRVKIDAVAERSSWRARLARRAVRTLPFLRRVTQSVIPGRNVFVVYTKAAKQ